jgi:hypothetical protein
MKTLILLMIFSATALQAEEDLFRAGQIFIDVSYGAGNPGGRAITDSADTTGYLFSSARLTLATNVEKRQVGMYRFLTYQIPKAASVNGRLGAEYALFDWLGIGFSVNTLRIKLKGIYTSPIGLQLSPLSFYFYSYNYCDGLVNAPTACPPGLLDHPVRREIKMENINTLDFDTGFHLSSGRWDPYFKMVVGGGSVYKGSTLKVGGIIGTRLRVIGGAYLLAEGYASYFSIQFRATESESSSSSSITDSGGRIGMGFSF